MNPKEKHNERIKMMRQRQERSLHQTRIYLRLTFYTNHDAASHSEHNCSSHHLLLAHTSELQNGENEIHLVLGCVGKRHACKQFHSSTHYMYSYVNHSINLKFSQYLAMELQSLQSIQDKLVSSFLISQLWPSHFAHKLESKHHILQRIGVLPLLLSSRITQLARQLLPSR